MPKSVTKNQPTPEAFSTANVHVPASNTAAVVTFAAGGAGVYHVIDRVIAAYGATPTAGNLKIEDGSGNVVFSIPIGAAGIIDIDFRSKSENGSPGQGLRGSANTALIVTLAAGGSGVLGTVNVIGKRTQAKT